MRLLDADYSGPVNLGTGVSTSIGQIAEILKKCSGKDTKDLDLEVSGPMNFRCDMSLLNRLTGWSPKYTIEEGIQKTFYRMKDWADDCKW